MVGTRHDESRSFRESCQDGCYLSEEDKGKPMPKAIFEFMLVRGRPCLEYFVKGASAATKRCRPGMLKVTMPPTCVPVLVKAVLRPSSMALTGRTRALSIVEFQL